MCVLLLKNTARSSAVAVRSFNIEVARISEQVTQKNTGLMRLKFWEDLIDKVFTKDATKVPQHPVAIELFKVLANIYIGTAMIKNVIFSISRQFYLLILQRDILRH